MEKSYSFSVFNDCSSSGISKTLENFNQTKKRPIVVCIGSDLILGDSLGPLIGTMLKKEGISEFVYGTLNFPITAKEIEYAKIHLKEMHPNSFLIAIDAAIGSPEDVGIIRIVKGGLKPGLGVDKNLGTIGDASIIGVVASKSLQNYNLFNLTRLNLVFKMAEKITAGIIDYISLTQKKEPPFNQGFSNLFAQ